MSITKIPFTKYTVMTGSGNYNLPEKDVDTLYGPGWPVAPVTRPEDSDLPREIDYPVAVNMTLTPRIGYSGLMPVAALKAAYTNISEVSLPVNLIIRELASFKPQLRFKKNKQNVPADHELNWLTEFPQYGIPFNVWMTRYKKSAKIYAAPAFYMRKDKDKIVAMEYIDGSTLFLLVNSRGMLPEPNEIDPGIAKFVEYALSRGQNLSMTMQMPELSRGLMGKLDEQLDEKAGIPIYAKDWLRKAQSFISKGKALPTTTPAFTQIIKGIPFSFWDKNQVYFMPEPPASTTDSPYGEVFIERAWTWINIIAVMTAFELGHYRTGNMPEGFVTVPKDMFPGLPKIAAFEREFNARMAEGTQTQHSRVRFAPDGSKYIPTKKPDFPDKLYMQARDNIVLAIGVPTSEIGQIPGKGLGGKGFETGESQKTGRQILEAEKKALESPFNKVVELSGAAEGDDGIEFYMDYPQEEVDPATQQEDLYNSFIHGVTTLNDCLTAQDKKAIGKIDDDDNIANMHLIVAGQSIYIVEKMKLDQNGMALPNNVPPNQVGGSPVGPEDAARANGGDQAKEPVKDVKAAAEKIIKYLEESGGKNVGPSKFYSLPEKIGDRYGVWMTNPMDLAKQEPNPSDAPAGVDPEQWRMGMEEEQEHAQTVGGDQSIIANIVMDHLREDPKYYDHLNEAMGKRYKVVGTDVVNIDTGEVVPGGHHKTKAEADAHARALYANVPDAKKNDDPSLIKVDWAEYFKHCGVCPEDSLYFGAPISREVKFEFPAEHHANEVEIVAMSPEGMPSVPALWKPEGGENTAINENIGGHQYAREEAAWLLDQCLGFHLVPLAYVSEVNGEQGAAIWFTQNEADPQATLPKPIEEYAPTWIERAAVLDYIMSQQDRGNKHNYLTHPDEPVRPVLIDNGFSFPADPSIYCESTFCASMVGRPLSEETLMAIRMCLGDVPMWNDIVDVLGDGGDPESAAAAVVKARACAQRLLDEGMVTAESHVSKYNPNHQPAGDPQDGL